MQANILIVFRHDEARAFVADALRPTWSVTEVTSGADALERVATQEVPVVVCNDTLEDMTGEELATKIRSVRPGARVVITSARASIENALSLLGPGQFVYVEKPLSSPRLVHAVAIELERATLYAENWKLRARIEGMDPMEAIIGSSMAVDHVRERIRYLAEATANVLIRGERGTGKQLAAEAIHRAGSRSGRALIRVDCAITPAEVLERELFGFEHPDHRGGRARERGKVEQAEGGTLLISEIGDMPVEVQSRLVEALRASSDVRVIATTHYDLRDRALRKEFREDLYYAVNVLDVEMPTLRERRGDVAALAAYFARYFAARSGAPTVELTPSAIERLEAAPWPGNVRELRNVMERAVMSSGGVVDAGDLRMTSRPQHGSASGEYRADLERVFRTGTIREMEKLMILNRLEEKNGNRTRSAESLEISVRTLRNKLNEYDVGRKPAADGVLVS